MANQDTNSFSSLLAGARRGERSAWEVLYREFAPAVLGYLRSQRVEAADDLLADTWLQVVRDLPRFAGTSDGFRGWILRIAHNRIVDLHRSGTRRPDEVPVPTVPDRIDEAELDPPLEDTDELERLFEGLPPTQRAVLYLRYVLDLRQGEIATILGSTLAAVKMQQRRGIDAVSARRDLEGQT